MTGIFISHSSKNNAEAERLRDWLEQQGWGRSQVFLDLQDLKSGDRWRDVLNSMNDCEAVIICLSNEWLASDECKREFTQAEERGKVILPLFAAPVSVPIPRFITDVQIGDTSPEGMVKLRDQLLAKRITPQSFPWPPRDEPGRSVYRGLEALDVQDAAIFFGRDADILRGLDELRRLRDGAAPKIMVILGASGAGKSSFLRAGLIARLKRDEENFLVLPIVRPERAAITGAQGLLASLQNASVRTAGFQPATPGRQDAGGPSAASLASIFAELRRPVVERLTRNAEAARETYSAKPPTIIVPIDQAEELFGAEQAERAAFCTALAGAIEQDGNALAVATIRSDSYEPLQTESLLASAPQLLFNLPPIAAGSFQQIIEGPARLAKPPLTVEPALTQQLLADLDAADALPLLAFTLERLTTQYGADGKLTLTDYRDKLGGLSGAIQSAVTAVLGPQPSKDKLALARRLFVPALVQVDQDGVKRRVARRAGLPAETQALADQFVEQRLLVTDDGNIEVAHEAILRQWPALAGWIAEERGGLVALDGVRAAAREWEAPRATGSRNAKMVRDWRDTSRLSHRGVRLKEAEAAAAREDYAAAVDPGMREYLAFCRKAERRAAASQLRLRALVATALFGVIGAGFAFVTQDQWRPPLDAWWNYKRFVHSAEELRAGPTGAPSAFQDCRGGSTDCPVMVVIPEGSAMIGAAQDDPELGFNLALSLRQMALSPQQVTMLRFAASRHEITWADWRPCVAARRCPQLDRSGWEGDDRPVINVSWSEARAYADWLKEMTGQDYRLLTEQEWEYAARGVTSAQTASTLFSWGDEDPVCETAAENGAASMACERIITWPAGSFRPNAFGLYDMHGNVWEWTQTCIDAEPSFEQFVSGECSGYVLRGGSWFTNRDILRSAIRTWSSPSVRNFENGFRVARTL